MSSAYLLMWAIQVESNTFTLKLVLTRSAAALLGEQLRMHAETGGRELLVGPLIPVHVMRCSGATCTGGLEEYQAVQDVAKQVDPQEFSALEQRILNRANAPVLILLWRRP